ncbi:MAG: 4-hydroxy-tetrahydrodipicolinate reductase [Capnocytophaga sp.]|nr:4-hydroxy-tetrahydrodipicolinate reductase [Capnocytophaga sp.]
MKIALLGYGKMGQAIEQIAIDRGHEIVLKIDKNTPNYSLNNIDVVIEFSTPESAFGNISKALEAGIPVVAGTTGWLAQYDEAVALCKANNTAFLYASNFSIGVNIFFEINKTLAKLMKNHQEYAVSLEEIHHTQKLDAPSGTAISLAEAIIEESNKTDWTLNEATETQIPIVAKRIDNTPGTHIVTYQSEIDTIEIKHTAHNRKGFALGAVLAAEWIFGKKGVFSMKEVLFNN